MIAGRDSRPPTAATLEAARARGVRVWALYHGTLYDGIDPGHLASDAEFELVRSLGLGTFAYVSGNQEPAAIRAWSERTGILCIVDVENGIRPDGPWLQAWLDEADAGLYGNLSVHIGRRARAHILAWYPGYDPASTWLGGTPPAVPHGLQWQGSHIEFGADVDNLWLDDSFAALNTALAAAAAPTSPYHLRRRTFVQTDSTQGFIGLGDDDRPYINLYDEATKAWRGDQPLGTATTKLMDFDVDSAGDRIDLYGRGEDTAAWHAHSNDGGLTWSAFEDLGGKFKSPLTAIVKRVPAPATATDNDAPVLAAIADLKAHPAVVSDPNLLAIAQRIESALKAA